MEQDDHGDRIPTEEWMDRADALLRTLQELRRTLEGPLEARDPLTELEALVNEDAGA